MCRHKILFESEFGCVVKHACSGKYHLGFGHVLAVFDETEIQKFFYICRHILQKHCDYGLDEDQNYFLNMGSPHFVLSLKANELKKICDMIEDALMMEKVHAILYD